MNNLTTRKIVLGMLMALVLAFSVQGIAEALTFSTSRSGDFRTVLANQDFTISFSVSPGSNTTPIRNLNGKLITDPDSGIGVRINSSGYKVRNAGTTEYRISTDAQGLSATDTFVYRKGNEYLTQDLAQSNFVVGNSNTTVYVLIGGSDTDTENRRAYQVYNRTGTELDYSYATVTADPDGKVTDAERYHYNEERISISVPTDLTLKRVKTYTVNKGSSVSPHIMNEARNSVNEDKLTSGTISLTYTASGEGEYNISITDTTPDHDRPRDEATALTFTVYVVEIDETVRSGDTAFVFSDGTVVDSTTRAVARSGQIPQPIGFNVTGNPSANIPLVFKIEGGGQVYARETGATRPTDKDKEGQRSSGTQEFVLSSAAEVYLDMRSNTNKVTVYPRGKSPVTAGQTMIYIHGYAQLEITEGDGQTGAPGGRLEGPLGVKVTDSRSQPIRYPLVVRFPAGTATDDTNGSGGGRFIPVPETTLLVNGQKTLATLTSPAAEAVHEVYTDSSSIATIYYQLNSELDAGTSYAITPGLKHNSAVTTRFAFNTGTTGSERVANLEILSGDSQTGEKGKNLDTPLVVIARSTAGYRIPNVVIQFRTSTGILSREGLTAAPLLNGRGGDSDSNSLQWGEIPANTPNPDTGQQIYVRTGSDGQASITYNVGQFVIARQISAEIRHEPLDSDYSFAIDRVTFDINGSGSTTTTTTTTPDTTPDTTPTLTVSRSSLTGRPGSTQTISVTASQTAQIGNFFDNFLDAGGSVSPRSGSGTFTVRLTLPSTERQYALTVSMAGLTKDSYGYGEQYSGRYHQRVEPSVLAA